MVDNIKNKSYTDKQEAIFKSTLLLIHDHGFHGAPMSQIAANAGVAAGTIYHYFASKEELILELFIYCRDKTNEHIFNFDKDLSYKDKFYYTWNRSVEYYIENKEIFRFIEQFYSSPYYELITKTKTPCYFGANHMLDFFEEGVRVGALKPVNFMVFISIFIGSATAHIKNIVYRMVPVDLKDREDLIELIWNGIKNK